MARGDRQRALFERAREARRRAFGDTAFVRGVVEISSYCRKDCLYCAMRRSNRSLSRYRAGLDDLMQAAERIREMNIPTILIQGGEDVQTDRILLEALPRLKRTLCLHVILNVGERGRDGFEAFRRAGADSFIMKFESSDPEFYRVATESPLPERLRCLRWLRELGFLVGTGSIVGLPGQTVEQIADDFLLSLELQPDMVSASPFIPNEGTPWESEPCGDLDTNLNLLALLRLHLSRALIPSVSALEKLQPGGQLRGFQAGANVITINFTPEHQRELYRIYSSERFVVSVGHALATLASGGLAPRETYAV